MYLENINGPEDVKKLNDEQMTALAEEMRAALLKRASIHGGHFGPNFGMVEATIALHYVFESPKDKIVYDVSHQTYPHKMLTGRKDAYLYEEHYDDVSGYSNPHESEHDHFTVGHTSTSVSLALGLAKTRDLKGEDGNVIAVIGDGSLSGGEALEGLGLVAISLLWSMTMTCRLLKIMVVCTRISDCFVRRKERQSAICFVRWDLTTVMWMREMMCVR